MRAEINISFPIRDKNVHRHEVYPEVTPDRWKEIIESISNLNWLNGMKVEVKCI